MIYRLTDRVWFGNWEAPFECLGQVAGIVNVAHHFSPRRGRSIYWSRLAELRHDLPYLRLSRKDRETVDGPYLESLAAFVDHVAAGSTLPILTHCQMGGHRGPSSGLFAAWHLGGRSRTGLESLHGRTLELVPKLAHGRDYYRSLMEWCRLNCRTP